MPPWPSHRRPLRGPAQYEQLRTSKTALQAFCGLLSNLPSFITILVISASSKTRRIAKRAPDGAASTFVYTSASAFAFCLSTPLRRRALLLFAAVDSTTSSGCAP